LLEALEERDLRLLGQRGDGVLGRVERPRGPDATDCGNGRLPLAPDGAHRDRRFIQRIGRDVVRIRERLLVAVDGADADAAVNIERAGLDDALLEAPAFHSRILEIEVSEIHGVRVDRGDDPGEVELLQPGWLEQQPPRIGKQRSADGWNGEVSNESPSI
jgi:hypothetical protein